MGDFAPYPHLKRDVKALKANKDISSEVRP